MREAADQFDYIVVGWRWSAADAFLKLIRSPAILRVVTGAMVDRVTFAQGRATSITYVVGNERRHATARGEVLLAAGAIGNSAILKGAQMVLRARG